VQFTLSNEPNEEIEQFIDARLNDFNDHTCAHLRATRTMGRKPLSIVIRDKEGSIVGGLVGSTYSTGTGLMSTSCG